MEKLEIGNQPGPMNEEAIGYFLKGLRLAIKQSGLNQSEFAEGVTSTVNLSNILRGVTGTSEKMREALARKAGKDVAEIVLMGKAAEGEESQVNYEATERGRAVPVGPTDFIDPDAVSVAVQSLAAQYRRSDERQKWWKEIIDMHPNPTLVFKDRTLVFQNKISFIWGNISGKTIDQIHIDEQSEDDDCPLRIAMATSQEVSTCKMIKDNFYKIIASPVRFNGIDYYVVSAVEINEFIGFAENRRGGEERRKTE